MVPMASAGEELGWRKGPWTPEEDKLLNEHIILHGEGRWNYVPKCAGLNRNGKSCRLRWVNYLRPGLKKGQIDTQEEGILIELHALWGNKWSRMARYLPGRTDNEIKNYWRTHFKNRNKNTERTETHRSQFMKQKHRPNVIDQVQLPDLSSSSSAAAATTTIITTTNDHDDQVAGSIYGNHNASSSSSSSTTPYAANFQASVNYMTEQQQEEEQEEYYNIPFMYSDAQITTWAPDNNIGQEEGSSLWSGLWNMELEVAAAAAAAAHHHHHQILQ